MLDVATFRCGVKKGKLDDLIGQANQALQAGPIAGLTSRHQSLWHLGVIAYEVSMG
jgi:hypothetical protein